MEEKSGREEAKGLSDEDILRKVESYFYENDELANTFERFVNAHAHIIDLESDEFRLEYTQVFDKYKELFEQEMTSYIETEVGVTVNEFYRTLQRVMSEAPNSSAAIFGMILQAVTDFDVFMVMMREAAQSQKSTRK